MSRKELLSFYTKSLTGKTPTNFSGILPEGGEFLQKYSEWDEEHRLVFIRYLERDSTRRGAWIGFFIGIFVGFLATFLYLYIY